jgi:transcriptional regulator GlxA family with amidase domain
MFNPLPSRTTTHLAPRWLLEFDNQLAGTDIDFRIRIILTHAQSNLQDNLSISRLASISNLCEGHICRLFRTNLGVSPGRCIKLLRLGSAADLLGTTTLSVKQVMARVGLNDESHFVRDFRALFGHSPTQYRLWVRKQ